MRKKRAQRKKSKKEEKKKSMRSDILNVKRIVVKVGSSVLSSSRGRLSRSKVNKIVKQVAKLTANGKEVILVSSGAIACGMEVLSLKSRPKELPLLQACAAIGQGKLVRIYEEFFSKRRLHTAQVLLTRDGLDHRTRYLNARNTLISLLDMGIVPVINENDTVATDEIRFGDNDLLSSLVAVLSHADLLINLSDIKGVCLKTGEKVDQISSLSEIDHFREKHLFDVRKEKSVGGMKAKLEASRIAVQAGVPCVIADGNDERILEKILMEGKKVGTLFLAGKKPKSKKSWLAFSTLRKGKIKVDDGAKKALVERGKSLLPSGIVAVEGNFSIGDVVRIVDEDGREFACGLVNYGNGEIEKIKGRKTSEIKNIIGDKYYDEVIHRDNLVLTKRWL